jgi:hypothetical protein
MLLLRASLEGCSGKIEKFMHGAAGYRYECQQEACLCTEQASGFWPIHGGLQWKMNLWSLHSGTHHYASDAGVSWYGHVSRGVALQGISQDTPGSTIQPAWNEQRSWSYVFSNKTTERHKRVDTEEKKVYLKSKYSLCVCQCLQQKKQKGMHYSLLSWV